MSQTDLAQELTRRGFSVQQQTVLTIEKGTRPLKLEEAEEIAQVLGVDPRSLVEAADKRTALLEQLRAIESVIVRCDQERETHRKEVARLDQEIQRNEALRQKTASRLVALFKAEGRPDIASVYADLEPVENLINEWRKAGHGKH